MCASVLLTLFFQLVKSFQRVDSKVICTKGTTDIYLGGEAENLHLCQSINGVVLFSSIVFSIAFLSINIFQCIFYIFERS